MASLELDHGILFISQVGYFLSPFDFLRELLTFFLFRVAFKRLVLFLLFMLSPSRLNHNFVGSDGSTSYHDHPEPVEESGDALYIFSREAP